MRKTLAFCLLAIVMIGLITEAVHISHRQRIKKQILLADAAIANLVDANQTIEAGPADLKARERLDELAVEDLNSDERAAVNALGEYLSAVEGVMTSESIETTELRLKIARAAAKKADGAMVHFRQ